MQRGDLVYAETIGGTILGRIPASSAIVKMGEVVNHKTLGPLYSFTVGTPNNNDDWTLGLPSIPERAAWAETFQTLYATEPVGVQSNMRKINVSLVRQNMGVGVEIASETTREASNLFGAIASPGLDSMSLEELCGWIEAHPFFARGVDPRTVALNVYCICMTNPHSRLTRQSFINFFKYPFWITPDFKKQLSPGLLKEYKNSKGIMLSLLLSARPLSEELPALSMADFLRGGVADSPFHDRLQEMRLAKLKMPDEFPAGVIPSFGSPLAVHSCSALPCSLATARSTRMLLCALSEELDHVVSYCSPLADLLILTLEREKGEFGMRPGSVFKPKTEPGAAEASTFSLVLRLISATQSGSTLYLPCNSRDMEALALTFEMFVSVKIPHIYAAMYACGASAQSLFRVWMSRLFVGFFSRVTVHRILDRYLAEDGGVSVLFQAGLCALKLHSILSTGMVFTKESDFTTSVANAMPFMGHLALKDESLLAAPSAADVALLMKYALSLGRDSINHSIKTDPYQHRAFRVPVVPAFNSFLDQKDWLTLWAWLPASLHSKNPRLLFSTAEHGYRLETLLNKCEGQPHYMIIKSIPPGGHPPGDLFGVFISSEWRHDNKNIGETFVFSLKPSAARHLAVLGEDSDNKGVTRAEEDKKDDAPKILMTVSASMLALGAAQGFAAISLDHTLRKGSCHPCPAFNNPFLASHEDGNIEVLNIECWGFASDS